MHSALQDLKTVLKRNGVLKATWHCGDLQKVVEFEDWGSGFRLADHPHHVPLAMLHDEILEFVELDDHGNGEICFAEEPGVILMTYSNLAVWSKQETDDGSCPAVNDAKIRIPDLDVDDFEVDMYFLEDRSSEEWITDFDCDIEFEDDSFDVLKCALQPFVDPYLDYKWYGYSELTENEHYLSSVAFNGCWELAGKTFTYSIRPHFKLVAKKVENENVTLLD